MDPERIIHSGRLGPGQMIMADLETHEFLENNELLARFDQNNRYHDLIQRDTPLVAGEHTLSYLDAVELNKYQHRFGYTREEVRMIIAPMASEAKDAVWSMGDDTPLAPLARAPRPVYAFFRQRFAQVTNPPIDPLREAVVLQMHTRLGPWPHIFEPREPLPGLSLKSPLLSLAQMHVLKNGLHPLADALAMETLECLFAPEESMEDALNRLCRLAVELVADHAKVLLLTDRSASPSALPIPMALALGAVHRTLISEGVRAEVGLARRGWRLPRHPSRCRSAGHGRGRRLPMAGSGNGALADPGNRRSQHAQSSRTRPCQGHVQNGHQRRRQLSRSPPLRRHRPGCTTSLPSASPALLHRFPGSALLNSKSRSVSAGRPPLPLPNLWKVATAVPSLLRPSQ